MYSRKKERNEQENYSDLTCSRYGGFHGRVRIFFIHICSFLRFLFSGISFRSSFSIHILFLFYGNSSFNILSCF